MTAAKLHLYCEQGATFSRTVSLTYLWSSNNASNALTITNASLSRLY